MTSDRVLVVGTSPLALLHGIAAAQRGDRVTIAERGVLGGSWTTTAFAGHDGVETACHLFEPDRDAYAALEAAGLGLIQQEPVPRVHLTRRLSVPYASPFSPLLSLALLPASCARRLVRSRHLPGPERSRARRQVRHDLRRRPGRLVRLALERRRERIAVRYVDGGVAALLEKLVGRAEEAGCRVVDVTVERVVIPDGPGSVRIESSDDPFDVDRVVVPAGARLEAVVVGPTTHAVTGSAREHLHLLLALPPGALRPTSYAHFPYHRRLHRVTDVTDVARAEPGAPEVQLALVNLRTSSQGRPSVGEVTELLISAGLLTAGAEPLDHSWLTFESWDATESLREIAAHDPEGRLTVLASHGDLIRSLKTESAGMAP